MNGEACGFLPPQDRNLHIARTMALQFYEAIGDEAIPAGEEPEALANAIKTLLDKKDLELKMGTDCVNKAISNLRELEKLSTIIRLDSHPAIIREKPNES